MKTVINLRTGDLIRWNTGKFNLDTMVGAVLEDLGNGNVDLLSHTLNGKPCVLEMTVKKSKLKLL